MSNHTQRKIFTYHCFALIFSLLFSQSGRLKLKQSLWQSLWAVLFLIYSLSGWLLTKYRVQYPPVSPHWGQIRIQYHSTALNWPKLVKQNHVPVTGILKKVLSYPLKLILESVFFFPRTKEDHSDCRKPAVLQENLQCCGIPERKKEPRCVHTVCFNILLYSCLSQYVSIWKGQWQAEVWRCHAFPQSSNSTIS